MDARVCFDISISFTGILLLLRVESNTVL